MQEHLEKCANAASEHIDSLIEQELEPYTANTHYFMEYRSKFFALFRDARLRERSNFAHIMQNTVGGNIMGALNEVTSTLTRIELEGGA